MENNPERFDYCHSVLGKEGFSSGKFYYEVNVKEKTKWAPSVITAEFSRIVTTDLVQSFLDGLDVLLPNLLQLYKAAVSSSRRLTLSSIMDGLQKEAHDQTLDVLMKGMHVGLLIGYEGALHEAFPLEIFNVAVVVEETIILHSIRDVPTGFAMLMGTIYCLYLEYPRKMRYSFEFLQRVIMKIKPEQCSARIHGLRNKLLRYRL
ncbi:hypothetical protein MHYP_G00217110 [Metynnis hypsauchen]